MPAFKKIFFLDQKAPAILNRIMEMKKEEDEKPKGQWNPLTEKLFEKRIVMISGPVNEKLAYRVNTEILALGFEDKKKPIHLLINSPGGEVTSGFSIFDTAQFVGCPIYTVVIGLAASMGSLIALCAPKKNRVAFPNSKFLIHQPLISGGLMGSAADIDIHAKDIIKLKEKINRLYSTETGKSYDDVVKATDRDKWLEPEEAKAFGLIDRIITKTSDLSFD